MPSIVEEEFAQDMFELAPVSLWLEDYSTMRTLFDSWRAEGVDNLESHLLERPERVAQAAAQIRLLRVNRRTLELFGASSQQELEANLDTVLSGDMYAAHVRELAALWRGETQVTTHTVNYTLAGRRLDVVLHLTVLPGHEDDWARVMVSIEDVTERVRAGQLLADSERYARGLFDHSPVSLWVEDWRTVKALLDEVRRGGIVDFRTFIDVHPEFVDRCMQEIVVDDVNRQTLTLFGADSREHLVTNLSRVFRDDMRQSFAEQLVDLWGGSLVVARETVNYSLTGDRVDVFMQFSIMPGHEQDWGLALVSLTDISARKKAEAYLEYLGKHDTLTTLRNRSYFNDEITRLSRRGPWPVSVLMLDLNGLKKANDDSGHSAGDALLRRAGEVLAQVTDPLVCAARIGGDEFCLLLPATDLAGAQATAERLMELRDLNNQYYGDPQLEFAIGVATCERSESIEGAVHRADKAMYSDKTAHQPRGPSRTDALGKR